MMSKLYLEQHATGKLAVMNALDPGDVKLKAQMSEATNLVNSSHSVAMSTSFIVLVASKSQPSQKNGNK